jgi:hypothetical protein
VRPQARSAAWPVGPLLLLGGCIHHRASHCAQSPVLLGWVSAASVVLSGSQRCSRRAEYRSPIGWACSSRSRGASEGAIGLTQRGLGASADSFSADLRLAAPLALVGFRFCWATRKTHASEPTNRRGWKPDLLPLHSTSCSNVRNRMRRTERRLRDVDSRARSICRWVGNTPLWKPGLSIAPLSLSMFAVAMVAESGRTRRPIAHRSRRLPAVHDRSGLCRSAARDAGW